MLRSPVGMAMIGVIAMLTAGTTQKGCKDARTSATHLSYYPIRDMRTTIALLPNRGFYRLPDTLSVPVTGKDYIRDRDVLTATFKNPQASDDSSIARGHRKFLKTCIPCHGVSMSGDGPVAAKFLPPPDLLGSSTRGRADGFIYSYVRHGGAIMPSYGAQVTAQEAYDLINFIRDMQKKSPR